MNMAASKQRPARKARVPASKPPYHHGDLRQALLDAAEAVLEERGVEGLTLRECARRAGVSHGAPAHHFGDVTGLLTEFTAISFEQFGKALSEARANAPPIPFEQLLAIGLAYWEYARQHPARFRLMFRAERLRPTPRLMSADNISYRTLLQCITDTDRAGGGDGSGLEEKAALAQAMVHGFTMLVLENPFFGNRMREDPACAHAFLTRMLRMSRSAFETPGVPSEDQQRQRATAARGNDAREHHVDAHVTLVGSAQPPTKRGTTKRATAKRPTAQRVTARPRISK